MCSTADAALASLSALASSAVLAPGTPAAVPIGTFDAYRAIASCTTSIMIGTYVMATWGMMSVCVASAASSASSIAFSKMAYSDASPMLPDSRPMCRLVSARRSTWARISAVANSGSSSSPLAAVSTPRASSVAV